MTTNHQVRFAIPAAALLLLWPALWNGYPIVFADTGTYLSQAIHRYAGWDRPIFYSLLIFPLHATFSLWPVIVAQAHLVAWLLWLVWRTLLPGVSPILFVVGIAALAVGTWLPWIVSEVMPDVFTPLLILCLCLLTWLPDRLTQRQQVVVAALASLMIASQQSSLPLACVLLMVLSILVWSHQSPRHRNPAKRTTSFNQGPGPARRCLLVVLPPVLALLALCLVNLAAHGRFAASPFGNVFLLARVIYDGPGLETLRRDCPTRHWQLCPYFDRLPPTSDEFLWSPDGPLFLAGGAKAVSIEADAIIGATLQAHPGAEARAAIRNTLEQLYLFSSGEGLTSWPAEVSPNIERDFPPREAASYAAARQQAGNLVVPPPLPTLHRYIALGGVAACLILLPIAMARRAPSAGFLLAVIIALPLSAAITGGLSAPHARYQSRIMWLPPFIAALSLVSIRRAAPPRT